MDPYLHTAIATGLLAGAYYLGQRHGIQKGASAAMDYIVYFMQAGWIDEQDIEEAKEYLLYGDEDDDEQ